MAEKTPRSRTATRRPASILGRLSARGRAVAGRTGDGLRPLRRGSWAMAGIALVIVITQLVLLWHPVAGVYVNAAAPALLVALALWREKLRQLAISAAIIPVATMVTLSLPQTTNFARDVVFYDAILILGLVYRFIFTLDYPLQFTRLTLRGYAFSLGLMAIVGEVLGVLGYVLLRHHYMFGTTSLPLVAATVVVFALAEETLFRGLIQQRAAQVMHPLLAAVLSAVLFTFTSVNNLTILAPLCSLVLGAVLAYTYARKQNLVLTFTINALTKLTYVGLMAGFIFR